MVSPILANAVGATCLLGGLIGFIKSSSLASMIAGSVFGLLYFYAGYLISSNSPKSKAFVIIVSAVLSLSMLKKATSGKPVPVLMVSLGIMSGVYYGFGSNK